MATDATGAPSPLGIPKFNTSADAPSGLGGNAQVDSIDALIQARVPIPASIANAEVPVWNGSAWVRSSTVRINNGGQVLPIITASSLAGGPPGSPNDGDIWIATAVGANGEVWQFRYNAGSGSTYKWEFIGGPPVFTSNAGAAFASTTNYQNPSGISITVARAGDYLAKFNNYLFSTDGSLRNINIGIAAGAVNPTTPVATNIISTDALIINARFDRLNGVAASTAIQPRIQSSSATTLISSNAEVLEVVPVRII